MRVIEPSDTEDHGFPVIALSVATSGWVMVTGEDGHKADVFIVAGVPYPIRCTRVWETGTTATGIRGLV